MKSKNARMGSGVGKFVRLTSIIKPGIEFIRTRNFTRNYIKAAIKRVKKKIHYKFLISNLNNIPAQPL